MTSDEINIQLGVLNEQLNNGAFDPTTAERIRVCLDFLILERKKANGRLKEIAEKMHPESCEYGHCCGDCEAYRLISSLFLGKQV